MKALVQVLLKLIAGVFICLSTFAPAQQVETSQPIKLRASKSGRGGDNMGVSYTLSYFMGLGLLIPGKNAEIKAGTVFSAFADETKLISPGSR